MKVYISAATVLFALTATAYSQQTSAMMKIDAANAVIEGNTIKNVSADIDKPGYLVIHDEADGAAPNSLGHIALTPGMNGDLNIEADKPLDPANGLSLMLHYETNDNNSYDFGPGSTDVDGPVAIGDTVVVVPVEAK